MQQESTRDRQDPDMASMMDQAPDSWTFNGYADQYKKHPSTCGRAKKIRVYLLDAGPSLPILFHVLGTVFSKNRHRGQDRPQRPDGETSVITGRYRRVHAQARGRLPVRPTHSFAGHDGAARWARSVTQGVRTPPPPRSRTANRTTGRRGRCADAAISTTAVGCTPSRRRRSASESRVMYGDGSCTPASRAIRRSPERGESGSARRRRYERTLHRRERRTRVQTPDIGASNQQVWLQLPAQSLRPLWS